MRIDHHIYFAVPKRHVAAKALQHHVVWSAVDKHVASVGEPNVHGIPLTDVTKEHMQFSVW
jgi:hypothetical protein